MSNKTDRYILLFGGIISLVFGGLLFTQKTATLAVIMLLIGLSWLIQGIVTLAGIFIDKSAWGWKVFSGIVGLAAGLLVLRNPVESTVAIPAIYAILLGILGLLIGISALIAAFQGEGWGVGLFGAFSLVLGLAMMFNSVVGGAALIWVIALILTVQGAFGIVWSLTKQKA